MSLVIESITPSILPPFIGDETVTWTCSYSGGVSPYTIRWNLLVKVEETYQVANFLSYDEILSLVLSEHGLTANTEYAIQVIITDDEASEQDDLYEFTIASEEEDDEEEEETTDYSIIFDAYLAKVTDDLYLAMTVDELELELTQILEAALPRFLYPKINLDNRNNTTQKFNVTLTNAEIQIISSLMVTEWVTTKIHDIELVRQLYKDHDFNLTSQAAHLRALLAVKSDTVISINKMMSNYYKVNDRSPDFSGLAGG